MMLRALTLLLLASLAGCGGTKIPPPPAAFDTVVVASDLSPNDLYAAALASFIHANWEPLTPTTEGLAVTILPDGTEDIPLALLVEPVGTDDAVLTARVDTARAGARNVLVRAAKVLSLVDNRISYE